MGLSGGDHGTNSHSTLVDRCSTQREESTLLLCPVDACEWGMDSVRAGPQALGYGLDVLSLLRYIRMGVD